MSNPSFTAAPQFADWIRLAPLNELGPGKRIRPQCEEINAIEPAELFAPLKIRNRNAVQAALAGLLLLYDGLEESHVISQSLDDANGSYWHAIMHRREPDYGNAKYWFRRVGKHPIGPRLSAVAAELAQHSLAVAPWPAAEWLSEPAALWPHDRFVDLCAAAANGSAAQQLLCRQIQRNEMEFLLDYCFAEATQSI